MIYIFFVNCELVFLFSWFDFRVLGSGVELESRERSRKANSA